MKLLAISGSPHKEGNSAYAAQYALTVAASLGLETAYLSLAELQVSPCIACWKCAKDGTCFRRDGMEEVVAAMKSCDALILASPTYFGMVSAQMKAMMDRCVCLRPSYGPPLPMAGKIGGAIACANSRNGGQETTLQNIQTFLLQMNMRVVSDGPPYTHSGGTIMGAKASEDEWGLETVKNLATNIARMLKA